MKIKQDQLQRLAKLILDNYRAKELIRSKQEDSVIAARIMSIISQNFGEEEAIEDEARKMLATVHATKEMDSYKMFTLAKQKIAAKKGFIL
jgi:hypothetical protein